MQFETLDHVVCSSLASRGYTEHWYAQFLHYACNCLRQLEFDVLRNIKSSRITVSATNTAALPSDFVDYVKVGTEYGIFLTLMPEDDSFMRLAYLNDDDAEENYPNVQDTGGDYYSDLIAENSNSHGEHVGRKWGHRQEFTTSFKLIRERNLIVLHPSFEADEIILEYISDGLTLSETNSVHVYALPTIEAYIMWQQALHNRSHGLGERAELERIYYNELRKLRARMNPDTVMDIYKSLRQNTNAAPKG